MKTTRRPAAVDAKRPGPVRLEHWPTVAGVPGRRPRRKPTLAGPQSMRGEPREEKDPGMQVPGRPAGDIYLHLRRAFPPPGRLGPRDWACGGTIPRHLKAGAFIPPAERMDEWLDGWMDGFVLKYGWMDGAPLLSSFSVWSGISRHKEGRSPRRNELTEMDCRGAGLCKYARAPW